MKFILFLAVLLLMGCGSNKQHTFTLQPLCSNGSVEVQLGTNPDAWIDDQFVQILVGGQRVGVAYIYYDPSWKAIHEGMVKK